MATTAPTDNNNNNNNSDTTTTPASAATPTSTTTPASTKPILTISNQPIYLQEDWNCGIGGGLWSMGVALAKYFDTPHAKYQFSSNSTTVSSIPKKNNKKKKSISILELGSGNGFLSVCLLAAMNNNNNNNNNQDDDSNDSHNVMIDKIVVTDTKEHLPLMEATLDANRHIVDKVKAQSSTTSSSTTEIRVEEYLWGSDEHKFDNTTDSFDYIIGSDLAYRDHLHDPLIRSLLECSSSSSTTTTVTLLGVTMNDTKPIFFQKLQAAGFEYERLADHLLDPDYRGVHFGVFVIKRKRQ